MQLVLNLNAVYYWISAPYICH